MSLSTHPFDYDRAAASYDAHRRGRGPYYPALMALARECGPGPVLEIGAGTGNNTCAFVEDTGRRVVAMEPSAGMLAHGKAKAGGEWVRGQMEALPFGDGAFAMVYGTYMLHHVRAIDTAFAGCYRALGRGAAAFVTVSHEFIASHPMNAYFPSFAAVDSARFQPIDDLLDALEAAGFTRVGAEYAYDSPRAIDAAYVEKVAAKFISTYALLPEAEFAAGLAQLRRAVVEQGGALATPMVREAVVVYGWKDN